MRGRGVTAEETLSTAVRKTDSRGVVMAHGNDCGHHYRRNILLLVLQVWIVPCHGFLFVPHGCSRPLVTSSALHAPSAASTWGTRTGGSGSRIARLSMSDRGPRSDEVNTGMVYLVSRIQWLSCFVVGGCKMNDELHRMYVRSAATPHAAPITYNTRRKQHSAQEYSGSTSL